MPECHSDRARAPGTQSWSRYSDAASWYAPRRRTHRGCAASPMTWRSLTMCSTCFASFTGALCITCMQRAGHISTTQSSRAQSKHDESSCCSVPILQFQPERAWFS